MNRFGIKIVSAATVIFAVAVIPLLGGCSKKQTEGKRVDAVRLFSESARLIRLYIDSLSSATDSATLLDLDARFSNRLTDLNFQFPSETDLDISEGENDTLTNLTIKYVALRDSLLYGFAHPQAKPDSITTDSISN